MVLFIYFIRSNGHPSQANRCLDLTSLNEEAIDADSDRLIVIENGVVLLDQSSLIGRQSLSVQSISKSFLALAFGLPSAKGFRETQTRLFPESAHDHRRDITTGDLLTQRSGLCERSATTREVEETANCIKYGRETQLCWPAGSHFQYSNNGPNLLGKVVEEMAGVKLDTLLDRELFDPLNISTARWAKDPQGNIYAMGGLSMTADDLSLIGRVILAQGAWEGKRLIDDGWIKRLKMIETHLFLDVATGYSRLWYVLANTAETKRNPGLMAYGWHGQYLIIVPHLKRVVVRLRDPYRQTGCLNCEMPGLVQKALRPLC